MNKNIILVIAAVLIGVGIFKPDITHLLPKPNNVVVDNIVVITPPADEQAKELCGKVIKSFGSSSTKTTDARRLSSLYMDIANLISLDGENQIIKNTNEIRQANAISGILLQLDIKGKYPDLAENAKAVIVFFVGDDDVLLTPELRSKASEGFHALSWACNEAAK
jgi:hypothetical protein